MSNRRQTRGKLTNLAPTLTAAACDTATLYTYPTKNTTFDVASGALTFKWEPSVRHLFCIERRLNASPTDDSDSSSPLT